MREVGGLAAGDQDDHGLADGTRRAEHERGDDARERRREDDADRHLHLVGAEPGRALAQRLRDGGHRVLGHRGDRRDHEDAEDDARRDSALNWLTSIPSASRSTSGVKNVSAK